MSAGRREPGPPVPTVPRGSGGTPDIADAAHKDAFHRRSAQVVAKDWAHDDAALAEQMLIIFARATHAAVYRGSQIVAAARAAAAIQLQHGRGQARPLASV